MHGPTFPVGVGGRTSSDDPMGRDSWKSRGFTLAMLFLFYFYFDSFSILIFSTRGEVSRDGDWREKLVVVTGSCHLLIVFFVSLVFPFVPWGDFCGSGSSTPVVLRTVDARLVFSRKKEGC